MNQSYLRHLASAVVILLAMIACVLPGQAVQPTPGTNANAIATAVAGTAQAAAQQTAAVQSPVPAMTGTTVEQAPDGTTKYSDYDGGFEVTFPVGWLALRPNSEELNTALTKMGSANKMLHDQITTDLAGYDARYDRLFSYALRPDIKKNVIFGFSKLVWASEDATSIDNATMGELVRGLEAPGGIPGFHADIAQIHEDRAVRMIEIGGRFTVNSSDGTTVPFYATIIFFKPSSNSTVRLSFSFFEEYRAQISADVSSIIDSIKTIGPQQ